MTDREAYEHLYRRYEDKDMSEAVAALEADQSRFEAEYGQKPLDVRKAEYLAMCSDFGVDAAEAGGRWQRYLDTGSTE